MASNAERAKTVGRALEANLRGDSTVVAELYTDDVKGWAPGLDVSSAAALAVELEDREEAFSDIELEVSPLDVSGDRACVEWTARMTHSGPLAIDDDVVIDPTGARVTLNGVTVAEFDGERIRSFRQYWDEAALREQILIPDDDD
jgi:ketosteroid isomerase-like protein